MDNWLSCLMLNFRTLNTELFQPISFLNSPLTPIRGFILPDTEKKLELSLISHFFPSSGSGKVLNSYYPPLTFYRNYPGFYPIVSERSSGGLNTASEGAREQLRTFQCICPLFLMLQMTEEMNHSWTADLGEFAGLAARKSSFQKSQSHCDSL